MVHVFFVEVTATQDVVEAVEALWEHRFPTTEGPLWCARLLPADTGARCCRPELAAAFPFTRTLLLANHHGIADGTTNMLITDVFLRLLDYVVAGTFVDDTQQVGKLAGGEHTQAMLKARKEELMQDQDQFQHLKNMEQPVQEMLIPRAYPMARDPEFKSQMLVRHLDKDSTHAFIRKCKKEGITVNSGMVAAINVALVDFVREGGLEQDFYHVQGGQSVNMRRYWPGDSSQAFGDHMLVMKPQHTVLTPVSWRDNFWQYARRIHTNTKQNLQERAVVTFSVMSEMKYHNEDYFALRPHHNKEYTTSNMGNLDHLIPTEGRQVRLAHLFFVTSCWDDYMHLQFLTLRGVLIFSLVHSSDVLTRANARILLNTIFDNIMAVSHM